MKFAYFVLYVLPVIAEFSKARSSESGMAYWGKALYCDPPNHYPGNGFILYYVSRRIYELQICRRSDFFFFSFHLQEFSITGPGKNSHILSRRTNVCSFQWMATCILRHLKRATQLVIPAMSRASYHPQVAPDRSSLFPSTLPVSISIVDLTVMAKHRFEALD